MELEEDNFKLKLKKPGPAPVIAATAAPVPAFAAPAASAPAAPTAAPAVDDTAGLTPIKSPIVGTFYSSPSPESDAYVATGSKVNANSIVCIVEAMRIMNEVKAEISGTIEKILVENGQPVEYGQPLFLVKE